MKCHMSILSHICTLLFISSCAAIDPWPTINTAPLYKTHQSVSTSPSADKDTSSSSCHCKFFLWDILSYIKYRETNRLIRENTYEGLGGKKFVRVQPGGYFERWLPQLRRGKLKKDACWLCGYSFRDHLEYWSKCKLAKYEIRGKPSAFDAYLDAAAADDDGGNPCHWQQYVEEVHLYKRLKKKGKIIRDSHVGDIAYLVPRFDPLADGRPKKPWTISMLLLARNAALERVDDLIWFSKVVSSNKQQIR